MTDVPDAAPNPADIPTPFVEIVDIPADPVLPVADQTPYAEEAQP